MINIVNIARPDQNNLNVNIDIEETFAKKVFNRLVNVVKPTHEKVFVAIVVGGASVFYYYEISTEMILNSTVSTLIFANLIWGRLPQIVDLVNNLFVNTQDNRKSTLINKPDVLSYDELQHLPLNYEYNESDVCPISYNKFEQGDTVCCDKQLYSYTSLKESYTKCFKLIPHSLNPLKWSENVYKLPDYCSLDYKELVHVLN